MSNDTQREETRELSFFQKLFIALFPRSWAEDMEADSRRWMLQCPKCGYERSFWDIGGIRWRATGNQRNLMRCPNCGQVSWHKAYRRAEPLPDTPAPGSAETSATSPISETWSRPRWLTWPLLLVPVAAIVAAGIALALGIVFFVLTLVQPIVTVGDGFMAALQANNDAQAYALFDPDLQRELSSVAGLSSRMRDHRPAEWSWSTRSIRNGVGRLEGSYTSSEGRSGTIQIILRQVDNDWRIVSFRFT
jgi:hypothetical protein